MRLDKSRFIKCLSAYFNVHWNRTDLYSGKSMETQWEHKSWLKLTFAAHLCCHSNTIGPTEKPLKSRTSSNRCHFHGPDLIVSCSFNQTKSHRIWFSLIRAEPHGEISNCSWIIQVCRGRVRPKTTDRELLSLTAHRERDAVGIYIMTCCSKSSRALMPVLEEKLNLTEVPKEHKSCFIVCFCPTLIKACLAKDF